MDILVENREALKRISLCLEQPEAFDLEYGTGFLKLTAKEDPANTIRFVDQEWLAKLS